MNVDIMTTPIGSEGNALALGGMLFVNVDDNHVTVEIKVKYSPARNSKGDLNLSHQRQIKRLREEEDASAVSAKSKRRRDDGLCAMLASGKLSDATLCVDGQEVPVHRVVLAAQSEVFEAMFSTDCLETATKRIVIEDIGLPVVRRMIRFLYSGALDSDADGLVSLLVAADKYMVKGLVECCQLRLSQILRVQDPSPSSAMGTSMVMLCETLRVAAMLDCAALRKVALDVLRLNKEAVMKSKAWIELVAENRVLAATALLDASLEPTETQETA